MNHATPLVCESEEDLHIKLNDVKREPGADVVVWGGARLAATLASLDLIDEYQLLVQPIALGKGQSLFGELRDWRELRLVTTRAFDTGAVMLVYSRPA